MTGPLRHPLRHLAGLCECGCGQPTSNARETRKDRGWVKGSAPEVPHGPIPEGLTIDHICRVTRCCNPSHLRLLTNVENARDNGQARKTHCPMGHPYDEANTRYEKRGGRACRACHRALERRRKARLREAAR